MSTARYDVAILGGGMAGGLLARQLRRALPQASIVLLEASRTPRRKVGESTVDIAGSYLTRRLGLSSYLYEHQLPKNGLRFFFDREGRDGELEALSEIGSTGLLPLPSFQLDRARFDEDLLAMAAADGVEVRRGFRATPRGDGRVALVEVSARRDEGDQGELADAGRGARELQARWVVDATGRARRLAKQRGLHVDAGIARAAAFGRFTGVVDLDDHGSEAWRARVRHTSRVLSTNHFCYPGYWIWLIPVGRGVTSVGVVGDRARFDDAWRTREGLLGFLREHAALRELLVRAEAIDVGSFGQLAYGASRVLDVDARWALTGEAAAFTDPLYSPGADFVALQNDWITDVIRRDLAGEPPDALRERAALYERLFQLRHRATLALHEAQYDVLGSFELFSAKWDFDVACYLSLQVEPYLLDRHLDLEAVRAEVRAGDRTLGLLGTFRHLFVDAAARLRHDGAFFRGNLDRAVLDPAARWLPLDFATEASAKRALPRVRDALQHVLGAVDTLVGRPPSGPVLFARLASGQPLHR